MVKKTLVRKVEGGKLFRLDVDFSDSINEIKITGDFFLHPEDVIVKLEKKLTGESCESTEEEFEKIVAEVLEENDAELFGASANDLAVAIKEVISQVDEEPGEPKFRFVGLQEFDAYTNMAMDEVICNGVRSGSCVPTIRIYTWNPSAVSIGYFQGLHNEVALDECEKQGVDYVRRRTGGGAVYHDTEGEITYSIIGPEEWFKPNIRESYEDICEPLIKGLKELGIDAQFSPINDIIANGKKISGNAQTRSEGILLQHGTLLFKVDVDKMFSLLKVGKEKIADKLIQSVKKRVTSISDEVNVTMEDVAKVLEKQFGEKYNIENGDYTPEELESAEKLAQSNYKSKEWNEMR